MILKHECNIWMHLQGDMSAMNGVLCMPLESGFKAQLGIYISTLVNVLGEPCLPSLSYPPYAYL